MRPYIDTSAHCGFLPRSGELIAERETFNAEKNTHNNNNKQINTNNKVDITTTTTLHALFKTYKGVPSTTGDNLNNISRNGYL